MGGCELCLRFVLDVLILLILSLVLSLSRSLSRACALSPSVHSGKWSLPWLGLYRGNGSSTRLPYASSSTCIYINTCDTHNTHSLLTHACFLTLALLLPWPLNYLTLATEPSPHRLGLSQPPPSKRKVTEGNR